MRPIIRRTRRTVTDGPYTETKELIGSRLLLRSLRRLVQQTINTSEAGCTKTAHHAHIAHLPAHSTESL